MAAGITLEKQKLGELRAYFEEYAQDDVANARSGESLSVDAALSADGATLELLDLLEKAGPYGAGHPEPLFVLPRHLVASVRPVGRDHLKIGLRSQTGKTLDAIAFRAVNTPLGDMISGHQKRELHVAGHLSANHWNGRMTAQLRVVDAAAVK